MSETIEKLRRARELAWADLQPAFDHAIVLAEEVEAAAAQAQNLAQVGCDPAYPALVLKLANSVKDEPRSDAYGHVCTGKDIWG